MDEMGYLVPIWYQSGSIARPAEASPLTYFRTDPLPHSEAPGPESEGVICPVKILFGVAST